MSRLGAVPQAESRRRAGMLALLVLLTLITALPKDALVDLWRQGGSAAEGSALVGSLVVLALLARGGTWPGWVTAAAALAMVSLLSMLLNQVPLATALEGLRELLPYPVLGLAVVRLARAEDVAAMVRWMAGLAGCLALYGLASYLTFRAAGSPWPVAPPPRNLWETLFLYPYYCGAYSGGWKLTSTFLNDNHFGVWLAMLLPAAYVVRPVEGSAIRRLGGWLLLGCMLLALTWTYSRSAAVALVVAVAIFGVRSQPRFLLVLLLVAVAAPLMLKFGDVQRFTQVVATSGGRLQSLQLAGEALRSSPLLGLGPGTRGMADLQWAKVAYETGLLGLICFGWMMVAAWVPVLALRRQHPHRTLADALAAGWAGMCASSVGGDMWEIPQLAVTAWMVAGLLWVLAAHPQTSNLQTSNPTPSSPETADAPS